MVNSKLNSSIRLAIAAGATGLVAPIAQTPAQNLPASEAEPSALETVTVTGTHVQRVDTETASPVFVLDSAAIAQSGAVTLGDLVSHIPAVAGASTNPQINNGGGFGETNIALRGLNAKRTLILLDGRRISLHGGGGPGGTDAVDINQIPINMIERVEVLKEGAGAIYGSDAIGGVVNFITRKDMQGVELTGEWGQTSYGDGEHHSLGVIIGGSGDKYSFEVGGNYNFQQAISAANRRYSKSALYLYYGTFNPGGSSRSPTGRIFLSPALAAEYGCASVTRGVGKLGSTQADYGCFGAGVVNGVDYPGHYNFQPYNYLLTPQERGAFFTKGNYKINDNVEAYAEVLYNHTHSGYQVAPLPFDANGDGIVISKNSYYNPFGIDFGGGSAVGNVNPNYELRIPQLGDRFSSAVSASVISYTGVRGKLMDTGWNFDAYVSYSRLDQTQDTYGFYQNSLFQAAVGPSFLSNGVPTCGSPGNVIVSCTPLDIFNLSAPGQSAALALDSAYYQTENTFRNSAVNLDFNGKAATLPAGDMLASVGFDYTKLEGVFTTSSQSTATAPLFNSCGLSQETCGSPSYGKYNYKEVYAELFTPLLKDLPAVEALNVDLGVRHSDYSAFGDTTKGDLKLEWRPLHDVLVRSTYSQVYRIPTINDLYAGPIINSSNFNDPCTNYTGAATVQFPMLPAACQNVPTTGNFHQPQGTIVDTIEANPALRPESGHVVTAGFVYDPRWLKNASIEVDYWKYNLNNLITTMDPTYAADQCATTGSAFFCGLLHRFPDTSAPSNLGQFVGFQLPVVNLGQLETDGVDLGGKYALRSTPIGSFNFALDLTHLNAYKNTPVPGAATLESAGTVNKQFGNFAKNRAIASVGWSYQGAEALLTERYIGSLFIANTDFLSTDANGNPVYEGLKVPAVWYTDLTVGYLFPTNTKLQAGIVNAFNREPPLLGFNNSPTDENYDGTTYDTIGRRFFLRFTQNF